MIRIKKILIFVVCCLTALYVGYCFLDWQYEDDNMRKVNLIINEYDIEQHIRHTEIRIANANDSVQLLEEEATLVFLLEQREEIKKTKQRLDTRWYIMFVKK